MIMGFLWCGLVGCATGPAPTPPTATAIPAQSSSPVPSEIPVTSVGKLSARLALLAQSEPLQRATPAEQAKALGLPASGPGSLVRDAQSRILVTIRTADVSDAFQQALRGAGADVQNISERYQSITAYVPLTKLTTIAALPAVQNIQEELAPG